jgi:hypothetical protein
VSGSRVYFQVDNPYYTSSRVLKAATYYDPMQIYNSIFEAKPGAPKGIGSRVVARQMAEAAALGVGVVTLHAAGSLGNYYNGYYTWPRLGYNNTDPSYLDSYRPSMPADLQSAVDLLDLMNRPGGATWWENNGGDIPSVSFDTTPGSRSWQALNDYLAVKSIDPYAPFP